MAESFQEGSKTLKKGEIAQRAISPFPTVFLKGLYCRHVKTRASLRKS